MDFGMMAVLQQTTLRVVAEQKTNTYPYIICAQRTDSDLMAVLQRTTTLRVIVNRQTYLTSQATSAQRMDTGLMVVLQRMAMPKVVARP